MFISTGEKTIDNLVNHFWLNYNPYLSQDNQNIVDRLRNMFVNKVYEYINTCEKPFPYQMMYEIDDVEKNTVYIDGIKYDNTNSFSFVQIVLDKEYKAIPCFKDYDMWILDVNQLSFCLCKNKFESIMQNLIDIHMRMRPYESKLSLEKVYSMIVDNNVTSHKKYVFMFNNLFTKLFIERTCILDDF